MSEQRYMVLLDGTEVAENMPLDMAMILAQGIFEKLYAQAATFGMTVSIAAIVEDEQHERSD